MSDKRLLTKERMAHLKFVALVADASAVKELLRHIDAQAERIAALAGELKDAENVLDGIEQGRGQCGEFFCADLAEKQRARRTDRSSTLAEGR